LLFRASLLVKFNCKWRNTQAVFLLVLATVLHPLHASYAESVAVPSSL
jgi:hypothetical protein